MTDLRKAAMQQALEALETLAHTKAPSVYNSARDALRAALDEPQPQPEPVQEPYGYIYEYDGVFGLHREFYPRPYNGMKPTRTVPVYTTPPQRQPDEVERLQAERDALLEALSALLNAAHPAYVGDEFMRERLIKTRETARAAIDAAKGEK